MSVIRTATIIALIMNTTIMYDFTKNSDLTKWIIVNDVVMGGLSQSSLTLDEKGNGVFAGNVSLDNNGGFCMVQRPFDRINVGNFEKIAIRVNGDGKKYQFRIKSNRNDYYSFVSYFSTSGEWETVEIGMKDMYPVFRGQRLDMPNFNSQFIGEVGFLIGNKKEERFKLLIDRISLF